MQKHTIARATLLGLALSLAACTPAARKARVLERAERYFKAGQYDQAKIEYLNILRGDGQDQHAYARLGTIWLEEGAPLHAGSFLNKAVELAPDDIESHLNLGKVYLTVGRMADAVKEAQTVLSKQPGNGQALLILADAVQKPDDLAALSEQLKHFPDQNSVYVHLALASIAAKKGDLPGAEAALQRALSADPNVAAVHAALGTIALARRDLARADTELQRAAELSSLRSSERIRYAQFKLQTRAVDEAKRILKELTDKAPDFLPAWALQARIANDEKKPDDALAFVQNVLSRDAGNLEGRLVQADSWIQKGDRQKAIDSLEDLDRTYNNTPGVQFALARAYLADQKNDQALAELDQVVHTNPTFSDAVVLRAELQLRKGHAADTIEPLRGVVQRQPNLAAAQMLLAEAYRSLGRFDEATGLMQQEIARLPQSAAPYYMLGLLARQQNKPAEARQAFEKAAELNPGNASTLEQLVDLDISMRNFTAGEERVNALLDRQPTSANAHYLQGKLAFAQNKFEAAQSELLKSIDLNSTSNPAYDLLIPTFTRTNKLPEALAQMNAVLAKNPNDVPALLISGMINNSLGDFIKARDAYEKLLAVKADSVPALNNLAYLYAEKLNDLNRAGELARKAHDLAPESGAVADTLGWILYKQGDYPQAAALLDLAVGKLGDAGEAQYHLGMADHMMGRSEAAVHALEKAVASHDDFPGKEQAQRRLTFLQREQNGSISTAELEQFVQEQPNDPVAWMQLGERYEKQQLSEKALDAYQHAYKANPRLVSAVLKLAQLNAASDGKKALEYARKARELAPGDPRTGALLGAIALHTGNYSWAYSILQEAARQSPDDPNVVHDLAWAAYDIGKVAEARQLMQRLAESMSSSPQTGDARLFLRLTEDVAGLNTSEVNSALQTNPSYLPALAARGSLELKERNVTAAQGTFREILKRFPEFAPAERDLADCLLEDSQKLTEASDLAARARKTMPDDPDLQRVLGAISYLRKEYPRAIQLLQQSGSRKPLDPKSLYYLGMAQASANHKVDARSTLNRAIESGLAEPMAGEAKRALTELDRT